MKLFVGLGNPGPKYETTRHNVGFLALDRLIDHWKAQGPIQQNQGEIYQTSVNNEKILLIKPKTFMNLSGKCVGPIFHFYKCQPSDLTIVHDDLDLKPLQLRIKTGGGTGGHNGLKSIDETIGEKNTGYHRIRIGIGRSDILSATDHVLQLFSDQELKQMDSILEKTAEIATLILQGKISEAMNQYNRSINGASNGI